MLIFADEILAYIRNLEDRVKLLEAGSEYPLSKHFNIEQLTEEQDQGNRPASVTNAMKVLEVHEQILEKSLDSDETSDELCDGEKALVREMCNVCMMIVSIFILVNIDGLLSAISQQKHQYRLVILSSCRLFGGSWKITENFTC